jgi:sortase (surface protein transpeptidase)
VDVPVRSASLAAVEPAPAVVPPVHLAVPSLGIALPIDPVGVAEDGQMEIPPLAERAGWYRFGAAPGEGDGTAVVAAHVDSAASAGLGPFARLPEVQPGAVVDVTLADGTSRRYTVTDVTRQPKPEIRWADVFVRDGAHRLVLVTCGGTFQREAGRYSDNVVVTAEPTGG